MFKFIKRLFCFHIWDEGREINEMSRLGKTKYTCLKCGKVAYYDNWEIPISPGRF